MHEDDSAPASLTRRRFLELSTAAGLVLPFGQEVRPAIIRDPKRPPVVTHGVMSGDVEADRAVVWSRVDQPARLKVRWATTDRFENARTVVSRPARAEDDLTARVDLTGLPPGQRIVYEARFEGSHGELGEPVRGTFTTPARAAGRVRLAWGGDVAGQGWGIDAAHGGMLAFESMRRAQPDLFIHSGDMIYADAPIPATLPLDDGSTWKNLVSDGVDHVAQTLDDFRGRYRYNLRDEHLLAFNAEVPMVAQWGDHEVLNNWYPTEILPDAADGTGQWQRYQEKHLAVLAARAKRAVFDYTPIRRNPRDPRQVYRVVRRGPLADVFVLDCRSYRGPNSPNLQAGSGPNAAMLGRTQLAWLEQALAASTATWKIIACDQPIGVVVPDGPLQEGFPSGDPKVLGREHEIAALLAAIKRRKIRNLIWVTADVHYAAAHRYDPAKATFTDFDPFWEFVAGPLHAGTFGPGVLDPSFGPQAVFTSVAPKPNRPPSDNLQFFGLIDIDPATKAATVTLHTRDGKTIYTNTLPPA